MFTALQNILMNRSRYHTHPEAVVVTCFFNPQHSPYRIAAFQQWYHSIKHLNHRIIECTVGKDHQRQLPTTPYITHVHAESLLWHKETLLNRLIADLPAKYRYVFWVDADVLFSNQAWLAQGVKALQEATILQPFEYAIHLQKGETRPTFNVKAAYANVHHPTARHPLIWRSFCANVVRHPSRAHSANYNEHGHVGFAWGARREVLQACPLYDAALIGGADHIIAHAAAGHIPHPCIAKAFPETLGEVNAWSKAFAQATKGLIGYVPGELYHLWHGDVAKRQYLERIRNFHPEQRRLQRGPEGLWIDLDGDDYMWNYYLLREVWDFDGAYDAEAFVEDMGYPLQDFPERYPLPEAFTMTPGRESMPPPDYESPYAPLGIETADSALEATLATELGTFS
jgi:hypothetical protein